MLRCKYCFIIFSICLLSVNFINARDLVETEDSPLVVTTRAMNTESVNEFMLQEVEFHIINSSGSPINNIDIKLIFPLNARFNSEIVQIGNLAPEKSATKTASTFIPKAGIETNPVVFEASYDDHESRKSIRFSFLQ